MILADTSVWIDHLRTGDAHLAHALVGGRVVMHPFVIGEIVLGQLRERVLIVRTLLELPSTTVATTDEILSFVDRLKLSGRGIGYVDVHLLAAVRLSKNALLWTRDRRLRDVAQDLAIAYPER